MVMKNLFKYAIMASLSVFALASCDKVDSDDSGDSDVILPVDFKELQLSKNNIQIVGASANGKYAVGSNWETGYAVIWNVEKNTYTDIKGAVGDAYAVTNDGIAVGNYNPNPEAETTTDYGFVYDGATLTTVWRNTELVEKLSYDWETWEEITVMAEKEDGTGAYAISEDGKYVAGIAISGWNATPCVWKAPFTSKSDRIDLPVPTSEELGFNVDGAEARWISADGSVVAGFLIDDQWSMPLAIWERQADGSYKFNPIVKAYFHPYDWESTTPLAAYMEFAMYGLSADGKWAALSVKEYTEDFVDSKVARLNLETKELEILNGASFEPGGISNDGTVAGTTDMFFSESVDACIWKGGENTAIKLSDMFSSANFEKAQVIKICYIAPDNKHVAGWAQGVVNDEVETYGVIAK